MQKQLLSLLIGLIFTPLLTAQVNVTTVIKEATVYLQSAQITRTGKATIPKGRGSVILTGLSPQLDHNSVRMGATGDFTILTVTPQNNFLESATSSPEFTRLTEERRKLADALAREQIKQDVLTEEEKVIMANKAIGGANSGVNVDELQKMATYLRTRLGEIRNERLDISEAMRTDQEKVKQLDQQLNEMRQGQRQSVTEVVVQYQAERATEAEFQLTYLVNGSSWTPTYDLRVSDLQQNVDLSYGALVNQQTGEDWKNIVMTLSTGNPRQQQNAPVIRTWWLSANQPMARLQADYSAHIPRTNAIITQEEADDAGFAGADVAVNLTTTEFRVRLPQDIPSNGQQYRVLVDDYSLPAHYQYYAAPKYDCHVYLTARVTDWRKYSLLPGQVNLFFDGAYVGKSNLVTHTANDTLVFSLGKDEGLTIEREREEDYRSRKFFGGKTEQRIGWTIKVKKNRRNDVPLIIEDQIPVSTTDEIEVELDQSKGASFDATSGKLRWELKMKFGDKEEVGFRYIVKHPKGMQVFLE